MTDEHDAQDNPQKDEAARFRHLMHGVAVYDPAGEHERFRELAGPAMWRGWQKLLEVIEKHAPDKMREIAPERVAAMSWLELLVRVDLLRAYLEAGADPSNPREALGDRTEAMAQLYSVTYDMICDFVLCALDCCKGTLDQLAEGAGMDCAACHMRAHLSGITAPVLNALQRYCDRTHGAAGDE